VHARFRPEAQGRRYGFNVANRRKAVTADGDRMLGWCRKRTTLHLISAPHKLFDSIMADFVALKSAGFLSPWIANKFQETISRILGRSDRARGAMQLEKIRIAVIIESSSDICTVVTSYSSKM
jgi:hypothetical protein